jgi:hypothetical protein
MRREWQAVAKTLFTPDFATFMNEISRVPRMDFAQGCELHQMLVRLGSATPQALPGEGSVFAAAQQIAVVHTFGPPYIELALFFSLFFSSIAGALTFIL